jgi:putative FmdB family regulatory protein
MPTYQYRCDKCKKEFDIIQKITEEPLCACPECASLGIKRVPSREVSIQFKGTGFYKTDYEKKPSSSAKGGCDGSGSCSHCK